MSDVRPPVAVDACGACNETHPEGWSWTEEAGRHRALKPVPSQRERRQRVLDEPTAFDAVPSHEVRVAEALELISQFGGVEGEHHKTWVIDQVARSLLGSDYAYDKWAREMEGDPEDEDNYYGPWDEGIAP
jgi:hypothetical protein